MDMERCPVCQQDTLRIIDALTEVSVIKKILRHLKLALDPPPSTPARHATFAWSVSSPSCAPRGRRARVPLFFPAALTPVPVCVNTGVCVEQAPCGFTAAHTLVPLPLLSTHLEYSRIAEQPPSPSQRWFDYTRRRCINIEDVKPSRLDDMTMIC